MQNFHFGFSSIVTFLIFFSNYIFSLIPKNSFKLIEYHKDKITYQNLWVHQLLVPRS